MVNVKRESLDHPKINRSEKLIADLFKLNKNINSISIRSNDRNIKKVAKRMRGRGFDVVMLDSMIRIGKKYD